MEKVKNNNNIISLLKKIFVNTDAIEDYDINSLPDECKKSFNEIADLESDNLKRSELATIEQKKGNFSKKINNNVYTETLSKDEANPSLENDERDL